METADRKPTTGPTLHLRETQENGMVMGMVVAANGMWKIEVFPSVKHAEQFAAENNLEVIYPPVADEEW